MRRASLDELPQLANVVRGEMSLVGPRPERPEFARIFERDVYRYGERLRVKSGITGWAQVQGLPRSDISGRSSRVGQLLHRELVVLARPQDPAHDVSHRPPHGGRLTLALLCDEAQAARRKGEDPQPSAGHAE